MERTFHGRLQAAGEELAFWLFVLLLLALVAALFLWLLETAGSGTFWVVAVICLAVVIALPVALYKWRGKDGLRIAFLFLVVAAVIAGCDKLLGVLLGIVVAFWFYVSLLFGCWCNSRWGETGFKAAL